LFVANSVPAQDDGYGADHKVRVKLSQVKDYRATGKLKTDVAFLKVPVSNVEVFYKSPDRFKVKKMAAFPCFQKEALVLI
jgi:hypothetical protein